MSLLTIRRTGSIADAIAAVRDAPTWAVPYAAATALTRCAQYAAKTAVPAEMRAAFSNPTAYTLNALRIEPATRDSLSARVMVKTTAAGVAPENFLFPQVEGGARRHKRLEAGLRYQGVLAAGQFAMPGKGLALDASGNVNGADVRSLLKAVQNTGNTGSKRAGKAKLANSLLAGTPQGGDRPGGIWRREGKRLRPLFVFTNAPRYSQRLDFSGVVQKVALDRFSLEFGTALTALISRGARTN